MWVRTYNRIRLDPDLDAMLISGPSTAGGPGTSWWGHWFETVVGNNTVPDQYTWHDEPGDPEADYNALQSQISQYGAPQKALNVNVWLLLSRLLVNLLNFLPRNMLHLINSALPEVPGSFLD